MAKAYIHEAYAEIREDGETNPRAGAFWRSRDEHGDAGERNDNRGGREQGIVVDISYLARDRVLTARYEKQRTLRFLDCECSSTRVCDFAEWY